MDFSEIDFVLSKNSCTNQYFLGCVDISDLFGFIKHKFDKNKLINIVVLLLLEKGQKPVEKATIGHYILLFWKKSEKNNFHCTVFDSLGFQFSNVQANNILKAVFHFTSTTSVNSNRYQYQDSKSCVCGAYCIVVALLLCQNRTLTEITSEFDPNDKFNNDYKVFYYIKKHFKFFRRDRLLYCDGIQ